VKNFEKAFIRSIRIYSRLLIHTLIAIIHINLMPFANYYVPITSYQLFPMYFDAIKKVNFFINPEFLNNFGVEIVFFDFPIISIMQSDNCGVCTIQAPLTPFLPCNQFRLVELIDKLEYR
jgi:hypothetical protein